MYTALDICQKTAAGQQEMAARSAGLTPRQRQMLVLCDGRRRIGDLEAMFGADDTGQALARLLDLQLVAVNDRTASGFEATVSDPAGDLAEPEAPQAPPEPARTPAQVEMARNFMINTLMSFCGRYEKLSLIEKINAAQGSAELRTHYDDWQRAILGTMVGKRRWKEIEPQLLAVL